MFLGGNNPRTESEELEGSVGDSYKIRNRSNTAYKIDSEDLELLTGVFNEDTSIDIHYRANEGE